METVLWFLLTFLSLIEFLFAIYFYCAHDDLKRGRLSAIELTESLRFYVPIEISIHFFVTIFCFLHGNVYLFILNLPCALFNIQTIKTKRFQFYSFFNEEYAMYEKNERLFFQKIFFYVFLLVVFVIRFSNAFSNMMLYRIYG
jgi:hypothetical protein